MSAVAPEAVGSGSALSLCTGSSNDALTPGQPAPPLPGPVLGAAVPAGPLPELRPVGSLFRALFRCCICGASREQQGGIFYGGRWICDGPVCYQAFENASAGSILE